MTGKALTIRQPWASLIVAGTKTIETRSWATKHRGRLYVHAGKRLADPSHFGPCRVSDVGSKRADGQALYLADETRVPLPLGAVVGHVEVVDCMPIRWCGDWLDEDPELPTLWVETAQRWGKPKPIGLVRQDEALSEFDVTDQLPFGDFAPGRWAWMLADPVAYEKPIPARGRQGLWDWDGAP